MEPIGKELLDAVERHLGPRFVRPLVIAVYLAITFGAASIVFDFFEPVVTTALKSDRWSEAIPIGLSLLVGHIIGHVIVPRIVGIYRPRWMREHEAKLKEQMAETSQLASDYKRSVDQAVSAELLYREAAEFVIRRYSVSEEDADKLRALYVAHPGPGAGTDLASLDGRET